MHIPRQMRGMVRLSPALYAELNAVLLAHDAESEPRTAVARWLRRFADAALASAG